MTTSSGGWLLPRAVRPGGRVGLVTPSGPVDAERVAAAVALCEDLGWEPVVGEGVQDRQGFLAGSDEARLRRLQEAFDDRSLDMIWAVRGGYGSQRIVDELDLSRQLEDPVPFVGFSDNTAILARHDAERVVSFHGPHPGAPLDSLSRTRLATVLTGVGVGTVGPEPVEGRTIVPGRVRGPLWAGNLAMAASMCGTGDLSNLRGRVVCLEDVGEPAYRIDRMLLQLERAGVVDGLQGLVFGCFTDVPGEDDQGVERVLCEYARRWGVPAILGWPFGHAERHVTLPLGVQALLDADAGRLTIHEPAVRVD